MWVMVYSHCTEPGPETGPGMTPGSMGSNILCRNVHTGPRQGQVPEPINSYYARPVLCTSPSPVKCEYAIRPKISA